MQTDLLESLWGRVTVTVDGLDEAGFTAATRAAGWTVRDLLFHLLLDAQRALVALATRTDAAADVDAVTYWAPFQPSEGDGGAAHAAFVRAAAAAHAWGRGWSSSGARRPGPPSAPPGPRTPPVGSRPRGT